MKTEERKKEDCELIDMFTNYVTNLSELDLGNLHNHFKADNDLLPKEQPNELLEKVNRLETELKELKTLIEKK